MPLHIVTRHSSSDPDLNNDSYYDTKYIPGIVLDAWNRGLISTMVSSLEASMKLCSAQRQLDLRRPNLRGLDPPTPPSEEPKTTLARAPCAPSRRGPRLAGILGCNIDLHG